MLYVKNELDSNALDVFRHLTATDGVCDEFAFLRLHATLQDRRCPLQMLHVIKVVVHFYAGAAARYWAG